MIKSAIKVVTVAVFFVALIAAPPVGPVFAAGGGGGGGGDPPASDTTTTTTNPKPTPARSTHKAKKSKQSFRNDPAFVEGYRAAYATIYDRNDYTAAIGQLKALGHDDY